MKKQSIPEFINSQVRLLIKKYPNKTIGELVELANKEFPVFNWNYKKIWNAITRINKSDNIKIEKNICLEDSENKKNVYKKRLRMVFLNDDTYNIR